MLLEKGADVNAAGGEHGSSLQAAAAGGHTEIVGILLEKGADVNAAGGLHGSSLQAATAGGHTEIVGILLEKGVNINAEAGILGTALNIASQFGHNNIVSMLLERGARKIFHSSKWIAVLVPTREVANKYLMSNIVVEDEEPEQASQTEGSHERDERQRREDQTPIPVQAHAADEEGEQRRSVRNEQDSGVHLMFPPPPPSTPTIRSAAVYGQGWGGLGGISAGHGVDLASPRRPLHVCVWESLLVVPSHARTRRRCAPTEGWPFIRWPPTLSGTWQYGRSCGGLR
ncbi:ankyrin repeat-containing domain protein [Mycena leptocephala]|nr:ankyrin repeat-containing domain protein [Mycena leptocephala]